MEALLSPRFLTLHSSHLSASEKSPSTQANFNLNLKHPVLARLERCSSMGELRQLHAQLITTGLARETFTVSRLIAFCALSLQGDLSYALELFEHAESRNLFIWNAMIRGFSRSNRPEYCLQLYVNMLNAGCAPDSYTFPFLLKACSHLSASAEGIQIHSHVLKTGLWHQPIVSNSLIRMYAESGGIEMARILFDNMPERDEVAWSTMIAGLVSSNREAEAIKLFRSMGWNRIKVDQITLATALTACAKLKDLDLGKEIHGYIEDENLEIGLILGNALINMYAKCGCMETVSLLFDGMPKTDPVTWKTVISGFLEAGQLEQSLKMVHAMNTRNMKVDESTFLSLISACQQIDLGNAIHSLVEEMAFKTNLKICSGLISMYSRIGLLETARQIFDEMIERDAVTWNSMIAAYTQYGSIEIAQNLFDRMHEKNNFSWSTMILGYVRQGQPEKAMDIYKELVADGRTTPDKVTILSALTVCSHLGALEEGGRLHEFLQKTNMQVDAILGTALIDMYAKCGYIEKATQVFNGLLVRNTQAWTAMISALAIHGRGKEALSVFREMECSGDESARPNAVTILSVLSACSHAGLIQDAWEIYHKMEAAYGVTPDVRHSGCMVDVLGRAGLLNEAVDFIAGLGPEIDVHVWGALLSASKTYGDKTVGEFAARKLLELDDGHDGAVVLLSNIYADERRWSESKELRRNMEIRNISKEVGRSWVEVNGICHEFTAGEFDYAEYTDLKEDDILLRLHLPSLYK